ncbi:MAG: PE-PGRS family protein, partial [Nannocystaceae bacterium]
SSGGGETGAGPSTGTGAGPGSGSAASDAEAAGCGCRHRSSRSWPLGWLVLLMLAPQRRHRARRPQTRGLRRG